MLRTFTTLTAPCSDGPMRRRRQRSGAPTPLSPPCRTTWMRWLSACSSFQQTSGGGQKGGSATTGAFGWGGLSRLVLWWGRDAERLTCQCARHEAVSIISILRGVLKSTTRNQARAAAGPCRVLAPLGVRADSPAHRLVVAYRWCSQLEAVLSYESFNPQYMAIKEYGALRCCHHACISVVSPAPCSQLRPFCPFKNPNPCPLSSLLQRTQLAGRALAGAAGSGLLRSAPLPRRLLVARAHGQARTARVGHFRTLCPFLRFHFRGCAQCCGFTLWLLLSPCGWECAHPGIGGI